MIRHIGMVDVLYQPPRGTCTPPEEALAAMDEAGVAVAMISQCKQWSCERQTLCVDCGLEDVMRFLSASIRFAGLSGYNPFQVSESLREMEAAHRLGFRGCYLHLESFDLRLTDARLYPLYAKSSELGQPVIAQVPVSEPDMPRSIERVCAEFPELSLAIAHPRPSPQMFAFCHEFDRLAFVLDTAALNAIVAYQAELLADRDLAHRCLWGSNGAPLVPSAAQTMALDLPLETLESVVRGNALRFFAAQPPNRRPQALSNEVTSAER